MQFVSDAFDWDIRIDQIGFDFRYGLSVQNLFRRHLQVFPAELIKIGRGNGKSVRIKSYLARFPAMQGHQLEETCDKHPCVALFITVRAVRLVAHHFRINGYQQITETVFVIL